MAEVAPEEFWRPDVIIRKDGTEDVYVPWMGDEDEEPEKVEKPE